MLTFMKSTVIQNLKLLNIWSNKNTYIFAGYVILII